MSQKSGRAPLRAMVPAVAKNVKGLVMTASPGPIPSAMSASSSASVPEETPIPWRHWLYAANARLELLDARPQDEVLIRADLFDRRLDFCCERPVLRLQVQQRHLHGGSGLRSGHGH